MRLLQENCRVEWHTHIIELAKHKLFEPQKSVSETAYELGFRYPQHFSRFFKRWVGSSPSTYRNRGSS
ncbi:MAG: AraC family transcriptional regulator [Bacteroidetes bacterium]|nr:MAG: AraC family transcriptional regulator [Bacteroidota bacterium]